jgi:hypothetical protein
VRRRRHRLYFAHLCLWNRLRGDFLPKALPLRQNKLVTFLLSCPFQDCGDREGQSSPSASSCVDTKEFFDERDNNCGKHVGYDCKDNWYINSYTPEGWKDLLRNCPVSCNLCDIRASRRYLVDDLSSDPCVCMPTWGRLVKVDPTCANQRGCPASACDNDPIGPWCEVVNFGCATAEGDGSWAYCSPGTAVVLPQCLGCRFDHVVTLSVCVFVLCTVMFVQVFSHPHVSDECLLMNSQCWFLLLLLSSLLVI